MESIIKNTKILVVGAGNFGTALAQHLACMGHHTTLLGRDRSVMSGINKNHKNPKYLKGFILSSNVHATELEEFCKSHTDLNEFFAIILAVPTQGLRHTLETYFKNFLPIHPYLVCAAKGIEQDSLLLPLDIIKSVLGSAAYEKATILSGPSFAAEIAHKSPTCVALAGKDDASNLAVQGLFHSPLFRVYTHNDPIGLEVAGALKNVIAIAAGAASGLGYLANSRAALVTRGLAQITQVGIALGANPITFIGLGGVGDLFLTCSSEKSRNYSVGFKLGEGKSLDQALQEIGSVAEGVTTAKAAYSLCQKVGVSCSIIEAVYEVLYMGKPILSAVHDLLHHEPRAEFNH